VERNDEAKTVIAVDFEEFKRNRAGQMHGGVTATLIDVAAARAFRSAMDTTPESFATTNLEVSYLRPATNTAYATAEVVRIGSSNAVARVDVESEAPDGDMKQVAIGTVTYAIG
jgi:uncharacterized protein (TIGR00369 family)